jgi:single-strand DNA-binding protein
MVNLNYVVLAGNLTRDPEVRYTPSGTAVGDLNLAVNRTYRTADGETRDETCFANIVVWGRQAETCAEYLSKGSPALVEGRLQYDQWEKDGQKQSRLRVRALRVQFLGGPRGGKDRESDAPPRGNDRSGPAPEDGPDLPSTNPTGDDDNLPF